MTVPSDRKEAEQALDNLVAAMHSGHYAVAELCKATVLNALLVLERERDTLRAILRDTQYGLRSQPEITREQIAEMIDNEFRALASVSPEGEGMTLGHPSEYGFPARDGDAT